MREKVMIDEMKNKIDMKLNKKWWLIKWIEEYIYKRNKKKNNDWYEKRIDLKEKEEKKAMINKTWKDWENNKHETKE